MRQSRDWPWRGDLRRSFRTKSPSWPKRQNVLQRLMSNARAKPKNAPNSASPAAILPWTWIALSTRCTAPKPALTWPPENSFQPFPGLSPHPCAGASDACTIVPFTNRGDGLMNIPSAIMLSALCSCVMFAQESKPAAPAPPSPPPPLASPEVHSDNSVTFRFRAINAQEVKLEREGTEPVAMQKDESGVWSVTTPPLQPDYYGYAILVDGQRNIDPYNPLLKPNLLSTEN